MQERQKRYHISYDKNGFPSTLLDWRNEPRTTHFTARHLWDPLEDFFSSKGYVLFVSREDWECCHVPKDIDEVRAPDDYTHVLPGDLKGHPYRYIHWSNKLMPATRKADGSHVMIQLVCKGEEGHSESAILRYFNRKDLRCDIRNHVIPLLDIIEHSDMVFVVTPLLSSGSYNDPWFYDYSEALDAMLQSFEGMAFLHAHLVAHGDFSQGEFLLNYSGSRCCPEAVKAENEHGPFRSYFPCRYYLVDFETAIKFDEASDPASRVVKPFAAFSAHNIKEPKQYAKPMPPEWASGEPYCPFASDVYQLAKLWQESFIIKGPRMQGLKDLLDSMSSEDTKTRPTMSSALQSLQGYRQSLSQDVSSKRIKAYERNFPFEGDDGLLEPGTLAFEPCIPP